MNTNEKYAQEIFVILGQFNAALHDGASKIVNILASLLDVLVKILSEELTTDTKLRIGQLIQQSQATH